MPVIHVEANLTTSQLLQAVQQLPATELAEFVRSVNRLPARAKPSKRLSRRESELLLKINAGPAPEIKAQYDALYRKWHDGNASVTEYEELRCLNKQVEAANAEWLGHLGELARLRQKPLPVLMDELGIEPPADE